MIQTLRDSIGFKWLLLALTAYLLNFSADVSIHEWPEAKIDVHLDETETISELILEQVFGLDDCMLDTDPSDPADDEHVSKNKSVPDFFIKWLQPDSSLHFHALEQVRPPSDRSDKKPVHEPGILPRPPWVRV